MSKNKEKNIIEVEYVNIKNSIISQSCALYVLNEIIDKSSTV